VPRYLRGRATLPVGTLVALLACGLGTSATIVIVAASLVTSPCAFDTQTRKRAPLSAGVADASV